MTSKANQATVDALSALLASSYTLYVKTHNYHWNVTGPMFSALHAMFELQYTEMAMALDEIAERIRSLGAFAPGSFTAFAALSSVKEENGRPKAMEMVANLAADQEIIADLAQKVIAAAEANNDQPSVDLAVRRMEVHQKHAWMLRSHME
ncbi:MAG: DNA starvation/stationary phase protection protein [Caldilineaceae bacterium]|nr:DNA starvation/stationary phase protection protein [Caldilineaceae bacterium]MBP8106590.1 DNA starvation/stationary phase protection protein [Caldilineaceae bacterium]MBP8121297.1 DNA starvation/stationary phase protection protein [Caldilineaceae bacterium]MBP9070863.1 DNA starvation/stationary phase protection protein [Caldilineaceae bacterium]